MDIIQQEDEDLRHGLMVVLTCRHPVPVRTVAIKRALVRDGETETEPGDADLIAALEFCRGEGWIECSSSAAGSEKWWTVTSEGVLKVDRREI